MLTIEFISLLKEIYNRFIKSIIDFPFKGQTPS